MDVKYQVFVSSTFIDLQEERRSVIESILNLKHIPVGMESFQAGDDTQWDYIKRRIDESDYYVVIVAERYGSEQRGKSYTQMEYEYAVSTGVPVAAFLLEPSARKAWQSEKVEYEKKAKVEKFRLLCQKKLIKYWRNADHLGSVVQPALTELMRDKPRTGWVRADNIPSRKVLDELAALSDDKRALQSQLDVLIEQVSQTTVSREIELLTKMLISTNAADVIGSGVLTNESLTLLEVFLLMYRPLSGTATELQLSQLFTYHVNRSDQARGAISTLMDELAGYDVIEVFHTVIQTQYAPANVRHFKPTQKGKQIIFQYKAKSLTDSVS